MKANIIIVVKINLLTCTEKTPAWLILSLITHHRGRDTTVKGDHTELQYERQTNHQQQLCKSQYSTQGVIQDFEVEGGNKKSNQKMLLKKRSTVISIPL